MKNILCLVANNSDIPHPVITVVCDDHCLEGVRPQYWLGGKHTVMKNIPVVLLGN